MTKKETISPCSVNGSDALLRRVVATLLIGVTVACETPPATTGPASPLASSTSSLPSQPADASSLDSIARGLASYLASSPDARASILELLRDAPARHAVHVSSFFQSEHSSALRQQIASRSGMSTQRVMEALSAGGGLQMSMPRVLDRVLWDANQQVAVMATPLTMPQRLQSTTPILAYTDAGSSFRVSPFSAGGPALLVIEPKVRDFGTDPEGVRSNAPRQRRANVSTREEEIAAMVITHDGPLMSITPPPDDSTGNTVQPIPGGRALPSGFTWTTCNTTVGGTDDPDSDGLKQQCEYEVAATFRPTLLLSQSEAAGCKSYEPYWAARPKPGTQTISVFYAIGYNQDCGSPNSYCPFDCESHRGDSEFIIVDVRYTGASDVKWELAQATLSAHWSTPADESVTAGPQDIEFSPWDVYKGKPQIWSAKFKHANYLSKSRCDRGVYYFDTCDDSRDDGSAAYALPNANLGRFYAQLISVVPSRAGKPGTENLWALGQYTGFFGWLGPESPGGSTQYGYILTFFGFL